MLAAVTLACGVAATALLVPGAAQAAAPAQITGVGSARCIDAATDNPGTQFTLQDCDGGANQHITLSPSGQLNVMGKCIDAQSAGRTPGTKAILWDCNGAANQRWKTSGDRIIEVESGLCLDAFRKGTVNTTPLVIWSCNGGDNQAWKIDHSTTGTPVTTTAVTTTPVIGTPVTSTGNAPTGSAKTLSVGSQLGAHDPSRIIEDQGSYYFWATGGGGWYSTDGKNWKRTPNLFPHGFPSEITAVVPTNSGVWAPDVIWNPTTRVYDMYYAVALWGLGGLSVIGMISSPTLNPNSPNYHWTDRGIVIQTHVLKDAYSAIDPAPFFDAEGHMWLEFGAGYNYNGMTMIPLNKETGLRSGATIYIQNFNQRCGCEGSAVNYHGGYYYLYWNTGGCCDGAASSYLIHVARSTTVTGPYTGTRNFLASTSDQHGPGQIGFISQNGQDYYTYHYYPDTGGAVMGLGTLRWSADGWPISSPR